MSIGRRTCHLGRRRRRQVALKTADRLLSLFITHSPDVLRAVAKCLKSKVPVGDRPTLISLKYSLALVNENLCAKISLIRVAVPIYTGVR